MVNQIIMTKKECLQDLKEILDDYTKKWEYNKSGIFLISFRLFEYAENWHYIDNDYYINELYKKTCVTDDNGNNRLEFNDLENQKNIIIVNKDNINKLLEECD